MKSHELVLNLRKNKLDMEYKALLQEMQVILVSEVGFPLSVVSITEPLGLLSKLGTLPFVFLLSMVLAVIESYRREKASQLKSKREEVDALLQELEI